ncbi:hypothetical protein BSFA1_74910 (plasmid) [Burkholderia sp. SFA1]|nr:hypothetical protein BSFA1_74910 [Burkholderia sp. SFA1]
MKMRKFCVAVMLSGATIGVIASAQAQGLTREQVRQQLIEAQKNGLSYVTDASYPDVSPIYQNQVARMRAMHARDTAMGPQSDGTVESGKAETLPARTAINMPPSRNECVGPASFCNIYFGN